MSASSAIELSEELRSLWQQANSIATIRSIIVQIDRETFVPRADLRASVSLKRDFEALASAASPPCYALFRLSGKDAWLLVSYVPDSLPVHDRMLYASSKATLSRHLGPSFFAHELQASSAADLSFAAFEAAVVPSASPKPFSAHELAHQDILREEEAERSFRAQLRTSSSPSSSPARPSGSGIGGYHTVVIPLSAAARSALGGAGGAGSLVELAIDESATSVELVRQTAVADINAARQHLTATEPRFYLLRVPGKSVFVYCCPDASSPKYRMVYSTAKPSIKSQIEAATGGALKTIEIRGADELTAEALSSSHAAAYGYTRPSTPIPSQAMLRPTGASVASSPARRDSQAPHPVYNMIAAAQGGGSPRVGAKKIVIPPPGAY